MESDSSDESGAVPTDAPSQALEGEIVNPHPPVVLTKHPEDTVKLLEAAFNNMFNISEACQYAGISRETYYNWLGDDNIFSYRMSVAQKAPGMTAKQNIMKALSAGDTNISRWYLERKDPEFKPRAQIDPPPEGQQTTEEKLKDFLDDRNDGAYANTENDVSVEPATTPIAEGGDEVAPGPTDIS